MPSAVPSENIRIKREGTSAILEIRVPKEAILRKEEELLRVLAWELRVPGFRPGKVPKHLLLQRYGEEAFWEEVRKRLVQDWLEKALREYDLHPLTSPQVKTLEFVKGESLAFHAEFEVLPEVEVPADLVLSFEEPPPAEVREEEIDAVLADLRREAATLKPKEDPAEEGDVVRIRRGGHVWEGTVTPTKNLGRQLLGARTGARIVLTDEAGRAEEFEVAGVYKLILPSQEETARHYGKETWEELREEVRRELASRAEANRRDELRRRALDALAEALHVPVPPRFLAEAVEEEMKKFPKKPEVRAEVEKHVTRRLRREILIHRLGEKKKLMSDPEEVRRIAAEAKEDEELVHNRLLFERVSDWILEHLRRPQ
jgi:trigger factor